MDDHFDCIAAMKSGDEPFDLDDFIAWFDANGLTIND